MTLQNQIEKVCLPEKQNAWVPTPMRYLEINPDKCAISAHFNRCTGVSTTDAGGDAQFQNYQPGKVHFEVFDFVTCLRGGQNYTAGARFRGASYRREKTTAGGIPACAAVLFLEIPSE